MFGTDKSILKGFDEPIINESIDRGWYIVSDTFTQYHLYSDGKIRFGVQEFSYVQSVCFWRSKKEATTFWEKWHSKTMRK